MGNIVNYLMTQSEDNSLAIHHPWTVGAQLLGNVFDRIAASQDNPTIRYYFEMEYESQFHPTKEKILDALGDNNITMYIADAHGHWEAATVRESGGETESGQIDLKAIDLHNPDYDPQLPPVWPNIPGVMDLREDPIKFAFLTHCNAMDSTESGSFAYALSKGQTTGSVVIGVQHGERLGYFNEWTRIRMGWWPTFRQRVKMGYTFWNAFQTACIGEGWVIGEDCPLKFYGDKTMNKWDLN